MEIMDILKEEDCTIETITPVKKKKMKQAQLPFQMLSSSKSPNNTNNVPNKKRKITSPLIGVKDSKVIKVTMKENSDVNVFEGKEEDLGVKELNSSKDSIEIITSDEEKEDLELNDQDYEEKKKDDTTPKKNLLGKNRKLDESEQKPGALTKFLKRADKEDERSINCDNNSDELKNKQDCQSTSIHKELVCDITIVSSDNETPSELDNEQLISSNNEVTTSKTVTPVTPKTDKDIESKIKKLTPKQLEKRQEIAKKREEKLKLKMEKEKQREEEKANRRREREEKQKEKEEKEKIEKEQKKKEKELKELKKQIEIEQKQKEKEAREEERKKREEAKEEEKKRKEEERLEAERKKQKAASNFASFFVSKKQEVKLMEEEKVAKAKYFMPFEIKADMRIAPVCRKTLNEYEKSLLDENCNIGLQKSELYLEDIRKRRTIPCSSFKTWPLEAKDDDIILLDEDNDDNSNIIKDTHSFEKHRPKLLQFNENRRPPYWGTWRKRSSFLNPRRPFAKDKKWFDYEVDSDDEWEEEEPGESLKGSDDEKDEDNSEENEYDVDNEFMVPHGYLSDEEAQADEEEMEDMSPQTQKMKLKILGEQFEAERNTKTHKLKPKIIGCIWQRLGNSLPESIPAKIKEFLSARQAWVKNIPIIFPSLVSLEEDNSANADCKTPTQLAARGPKKTKFPNEALPDLIRLLHGNTYGRRFLMREFMTFWSKNGGSQLSKVSVLSKINEIANRMACPEEGPMHLKSCWYVAEDIRKQYLPDDELPLPNRWTYILTPRRKGDTSEIITDKAEKEEKEKEKKFVPLITQFTKVITQEEMKKQLVKSDQEETKKQMAPKPDQVPVTPKLPPLQRPPKRATLISVGRGEQFPEKSRENTLVKFVNLNKKKEEPSSSDNMIVNSDDVIFLESTDTNKTDQNSESSRKS